LNQREYCELHGLPLKRFGNWRATLRHEESASVGKLLYRRGAGRRRNFSGAGHGSALHAGEAHEQALKEAETDATKRALSSFGNIFGLALYDREKRGVRAAKRRYAPNPVAPRTHTGTLVLALSATDLEVFERPEAYCSAFRKVVELIRSADALMSYWKANQDTVIDMDRVVTDPQYRQEVIEFLNASEFGIAVEPGNSQTDQPKIVG
jgi:hypothetical protein